jgi:hypothetical protein
MAFTATVQFKTVFGNKRAVSLLVTADANSGAVDTGLSVIDAVYVGVVSAATGAQKFKKNVNSGATALNGSLMMSSCTNGDAFNVLCVGT